MIPMFRTRDRGTSRITGAPFPFTCAASAAAISPCFSFSPNQTSAVTKYQRPNTFDRSFARLKEEEAEHGIRGRAQGAA
jgi:hypothetical protein